MFDGSLWEGEKLLLYPRDGLSSWGRWKGFSMEPARSFSQEPFCCRDREMLLVGSGLAVGAHSWLTPALTPPAPAPQLLPARAVPGAQARQPGQGGMFLGELWRWILLSRAQSRLDLPFPAPSCCWGIAVPAAGRALCTQLTACLSVPLDNPDVCPQMWECITGASSTWGSSGVCRWLRSLQGHSKWEKKIQGCWGLMARCGQGKTLEGWIYLGIYVFFIYVFYTVKWFI